MKRILAICMILCLCTTLFACGSECDHDYEKAFSWDGSCSEFGGKILSCAECGNVKVKKTSKGDHEYGEATISREATCTEDGAKSFTCKNCQHTYTETLDALGHKWIKIEGTEGKVCRNCGKTKGNFSENTGNNSPNDSLQSFDIKVWVPAEDLSEGNNWLVKMEEAFEAAHPEYKINWINESIAEGDAGYTVSCDVAAAADVYMFSSDQLSTLITAGGLTSLSGQFAEQVKNDNSQMVVNTVTHTDGQIYGFPVTNTTWFMYYNKNVYTEEDVKSLDTMLAKAKVCMPFSDGWTAGAFFLGCGGTVFGEAGNDTSAGIQFGEANGGFVAAKKMIDIIANPNCVYGGMDTGKLIDGEVAAAFSGSWAYNDVAAAMGDMLGIATLPTFEAEGKTYAMTALSGTKCVGVNPNSNSVEGKKKVCTEFAAFLASVDAQLERYNMRGVIPVAQSLLNNKTVQSDSLAVTEINTMTYRSVVQPGIPEMNNYWTPVATFAACINNGDITTDNYQNYVDQFMEALNNGSL